MLDLPLEVPPHILKAARGFMAFASNPTPGARAIPELPKSLRKLTEELSTQQQARVLEIRERILSFDARLIEMGKTTTTQYGLHKGKNDIYKTKMCVQFTPIRSGVYRPRLLLLLPYPKKELLGPGRSYYKTEPVKGMAWAQVELWDENKGSQSIYFYVGNSRQRYSFCHDFTTYSQVYTNLTGSERNLIHTNDLVDLALDEWRILVAPI